MATRVGGRVHWLWRAVDEHGQTLDVLVQARRDTAAAERFFRRLLAAADRLPPDRTTTDKLGSYAAALPRGPAMHAAERGQVRAARRCTFSRVGNRLGPRRPLLTAAAYGVTRRERVATWREGAGLRAT
jgi:transposase-like protein